LVEEELQRNDIYIQEVTRAACETTSIEIGDYAIASCNVGASVAGTGAASYGNYFQRGNNFGFPASGSLSTTGLVDASEYGPNTVNGYYYSGVFISVDNQSP
jgi:hypothetical protein